MKKPSVDSPDFLKGIIDSEKYKKWLDRKARAHVKRDRDRGFKGAIVEEYKKEIHGAVIRSRGKDEYTGWKLDWEKIGKFDSKRRDGREGIKYMKEFARLPTVDHEDSNSKVQKFRICSWIINDMKSNLSLNEFKKNCRAVLRYNSEKSN